MQSSLLQMHLLTSTTLLQKRLGVGCSPGSLTSLLNTVKT